MTPATRIDEGRSQQTLPRGFSVIELLAVLGVMTLLLAFLLPAVQQVREVARHTQCRSNLKQLGLAMSNYESQHSGLPMGVTSSLDGSLAYGNANTSLLPFLECAALADAYDATQPWDMQQPEVASAVVPVFDCPSSTEANPFVAESLAGYTLPVGLTFGTTDYIYSKGATDAWCLPLDGSKRKRGGLFDANQFTRLPSVTDGTSTTIAMGEGTGGGRWLLGRGAGSTTPFEGPAGNVQAANPWIMGVVGNVVLEQSGFVLGGIWGATIERPNKYPVTDTWFDLTAFNDARASTEGGPHSTANFRSDHPGQVTFLLADGAVRSFSESIDLETYRRLSTIADGLPAPIP
jgi:type II secretory pathway pseudopilin PulG